MKLRFMEKNLVPFKIDNLSIVIPVYNSENTISELVDGLISVLKSDFKKIEVILVNDGSVDNSHMAAVEIFNKHKDKVKYICLSKNFGEHNAVMCGFNYVSGDCAVIIDDDFQNPSPEIIDLVEKLSEGYEVVYSYYSVKQHSWFRNMGSKFANWVASLLIKKPKDLYLSSFKAIKASLIRSIVQYKGPFPYIDGIILRSTNKIGKRLSKHEKRKYGKSTYTLKKLIKLWLNMFTGYSILPLRIASYLGLFMACFSVCMLIFFIASYLSGGLLFKQKIPPGWASIITSIMFFAGLQLIILGVIGEYLGRLFLTANKSPQYIISEIFENKIDEQEQR